MLDRWLVRGAVAVVVTLQLSLINDFAYGTRWLAPVLEVILLVPLTALTLRADALARHADTSEQWESANAVSPFNLVLGVALVVVVSFANGRALLLLLSALLAGRSHNGRDAAAGRAEHLGHERHRLLALVLGARPRRTVIGRARSRGPSEFIFPQMTLPAGTVGADAKPGFVDYLFLSFNTSTAFSPTDTMPLTRRMKLLMMLESFVSLLTLALVAARAVNILA